MRSLAPQRVLYIQSTRAFIMPELNLVINYPDSGRVLQLLANLESEQLSSKRCDFTVSEKHIGD